MSRHHIRCGGGSIIPQFLCYKEGLVYVDIIVTSDILKTATLHSLTITCLSIISCLTSSSSLWILWCQITNAMRHGLRMHLHFLLEVSWLACKGIGMKSCNLVGNSPIQTPRRGASRQIYISLYSILEWINWFLNRFYLFMQYSS